MKKIYLICCLTMILFSCESFLEEKPKSQISSADFFNSAEDAYSAVNILYRKGFPTFYNTSINSAARIMDGGFLAGLFDNQYKGEFIVRSQGLNVDAGLDNAALISVWQSSYEAIVRNANFAIKYIPESDGLNEEERNLLIAEAKFFRALNYFYLVKMFGAVPIITEPYESLEDIYVRRSSEEKVYALIVQDLKDALDHGGLNDRPMPENNFRISKGSVTALLADVYINMAGYPLMKEELYQEAAQMAASLINNPNYNLVSNRDMGAGSAYSIMRASDNESEYLYTVEYDQTISTGGGYPMFCFPQEASSWGEFPNYVMANLGYDPITFLHQVYDADHDLRYQEQQYFHRSYTQRNGPMAGTVRRFEKPIPFFWWEPEAALVTGVSTKDRVHYRLAEMYLIAAEATAKSTGGVTMEAAEYLAHIQARASLNKTLEEIKLELMNLPLEEFLMEVWRERIRELMFENKIWNDITRTRMYPVESANNNLDFTGLIGTTNPFGGVYTEEKLYLPIGVLELQRNPALLEPPL